MTTDWNLLRVQQTLLNIIKLFADQIGAVEWRDGPVWRRQDPEQHAGWLGVRRRGGGRRARRHPAVRQPSGRDGRRQRDRCPVGRWRGCTSGRKRIPHTSGRHAAPSVRTARQVHRQRRSERGSGPFPFRAGGRCPRVWQPVHLRLWPATHQCAEAQPGVPGFAAAGHGQPVCPFTGRQLLPAAGQHHACRLQGPAGQRDCLWGRQRDRGPASPLVNGPVNTVQGHRGP